MEEGELFLETITKYKDQFLSGVKEIFENPNDLMMSIHENGILITRGPEGNYKVIIKESMEFDKNALKEGKERIKRILSDTVFILSQKETSSRRNPRLTNEGISAIMKQLKKHGRAYTFPVS